MIGNHPDMIGLAETNLFSADNYIELERRFLIDARFQQGLLRSIAEIGLGEQSEQNIEYHFCKKSDHWSDRFDATLYIYS